MAPHDRIVDVAGEEPVAATQVGSNLALVLAAWNTIVQSGSTRDLAQILHDSVVWQGALPDSVAMGRDEVLGVLADNGRQRTVSP